MTEVSPFTPDSYGKPDLVPSFEMPVEFVGERLTWIKGYRPSPNFLAQFETAGGAAYLFAIQFDLGQTIDKLFGGGHFIHYLVLWRRDDLAGTEQLCQHAAGSVFYRRQGFDFDSVDAVAARKRISSPAERPSWKWSEAFWPSANGELLTFLGRATYSGTGAYLFCCDGSMPQFAIFDQQIDLQTAEEHYAEEAARADKGQV